MNVVDVIIVIFLVAGLIGGWRSGFVSRLASWIGLAIGLALAIWLLPRVLGVVDELEPLIRFLVAIAVLFGLGLGGQSIGFAIGARMRPRTDGGEVATWDHWWGLGAGLVGTVALLWLFLPIAANAPNDLSRRVSESHAVGVLDAVLPAPPDAFEAVQTLAGPNFPRVFEALDPSLQVGEPPAATGLGEATLAETTRSVVKVQGTACYRLQTGTGFVAEPGLVMTNAHVVAGVADPVVIRDDGSSLDAEVVLFDPDLDLALLEVSALDRPVLSFGSSDVGDTGGVFGHPLGRPLRVAPFQVTHRIVALGRDIYDQAPVSREVLVLAGDLEQGDSGSALVDGDGQVVGVAFAISPDAEDVAYALTADDARATLEAGRTADADTGPCTH